MDLRPEEIEDLLAAMPIGKLVVDGHPDRRAMRAAIEGVAHEDLVTTMVGGGLEAEFRGYAGFAEAWKDWLAPFEHYESELDQVVEAPGERLLVPTRQRATPAGGQTPIESVAAAVLEFREGRLARIEFHLDPAAARRAAGLEEG